MIRKIWRAILSFFLPSRCPFCGDLVEKEGEYCAECKERRPICHRYTLTPNAKRKDLMCLRAAYYYGGSARRATMSLKFRNHHSAAAEFAEALAGLEQVSGLSGADYVTSVPLSRKRLAQRGYNQSELIARQYATYQGLPYREVLEKHTHTAKQSLLLGARARAANIRDCYRVLDTADVNKKTIVLIDDVYTTGATMRECARTLRHAGASCVIGLTGCTGGKKRK